MENTEQTKMVAKHRCPKCNSEHLESYKDGSTVYIKCDDCGHILSKFHNDLPGIDYKSVLPLFAEMAAFAVIFAFAIRYFMFIMGVNI